MATGYFSFSFSLCLVFSFVLFFLFLFFSFSLFSSHFPFISPHFLFSFWSFSHPFWSHHTSGQREEIASPFPEIKGVALPFHISFSYFLMTSSPHGFIWPWNSFSHTWLIVSHSFKWTTWLCQVSLFYGAMWHLLSLPCVIRHPTSRKT